MNPKDSPKSVTLEMKGFPQVVNALGSIPGAVKFATRKIDRGDVAGGSEALVSSLAKVELAKAVILSNLAFASMKAGDIGQATGYVEIALESLTELGMDDTDVAGMLKVAYSCLPDQFKSSEGEGAAVESAEGGSTGGAQDTSAAFDALLKDSVQFLMSVPAPSGKDGEKPSDIMSPPVGENPVVAGTEPSGTVNEQ